MTGPRVLVVDGNLAETRALQIAAGGNGTGEGYVAALIGLSRDLHCDIVRPADGEFSLPSGVALNYDGVAITGSALNIYDGGPHIERQVQLAKAVFDAGVPFFGSCWGLQVAVTAAGGVVRPNPRGREFGFGRRISLNTAGRAHPMFVGKAATFEAVTVHRDEISELPAGGIPLASNEMGLQAAEICHGRGVFWGVQYHPEYSYAEIAATAVRYGHTLIAEELFSDAADINRFVAELRVLDASPHSPALNWRLGLGPGIRDHRQKLAEIDNWLRREVLSRFGQRQ